MATLSVARVRSILELSGALARQPSALGPQLQQLAEDLSRLLSSQTAFGCSIEEGLSAPGCVVSCGHRDAAEVRTILRRMAGLSRARGAGTSTFRGDCLVEHGQSAWQQGVDEPEGVSSGGERTAFFFRREPRRVICLAFIRDTAAAPFSRGDLASIDLMVSSGWVPAEDRPIPASASMRQRQLIELLKSGCSEKEAAKEMEISFHTVHTYVKKIYQRFGVTSRQELLRFWIR